jgi:HK97 gp10 family phage protein
MLKSRIPRIAADLERLMEDVEERGAEAVKRDAKARVAVLTGNLRNRIHTDRQVEGTYVLGGDKEAWYGHLVEFGTTHSAAQPFLVPALEENRDNILADGRRTLRGL